MIPKEFKLGDNKYIVEKIDREEEPNGELLFGECGHVESKLLITKELLGVKMSSERMEQTFYHELVHAMLCEMCALRLNEDEVFVQSLARMIREYENTKK